MQPEAEDWRKTKRLSFKTTLLRVQSQPLTRKLWLSWSGLATEHKHRPNLTEEHPEVKERCPTTSRSHKHRAAYEIIIISRQQGRQRKADDTIIDESLCKWSMRAELPFKTLITAHWLHLLSAQQIVLWACVSAKATYYGMSHTRLPLDRSAHSLWLADWRFLGRQDILSGHGAATGHFGRVFLTFRVLESREIHSLKTFSEAVIWSKCKRPMRQSIFESIISSSCSMWL